MSLQLWRPNGRTPRAISLTRVSSDPKLESTSHETQHAANLRCISSLGATLFNHYRETVSGALYLTRQETQQALADLEAGRADYLILYDMTRYGRSVRWQQEILARVEVAEKRIQFATFPLQYDDETNRLTPNARFMFNNFGNNSELERSVIIERTQRGVRRQLDLGVMPKRSRCAFGYHIVTDADVIRGERAATDKGHYFVVEEQRQGALEVFEKYRETKSLSKVETYMWNAYPPEVYGRLWRRTSIRDMLRNPIYKGKPAYGKRISRIDERRTERGLRRDYTIPTPPEKWIYLECEAIVSEKLWDECQQLLNEGRATRSGRTEFKFALTGLVHCPKCNYKMSGTTVTGRPGSVQKTYYACRRALVKVTVPSETEKRALCTIKRNYLRCDLTDTMVFNALLGLLEDPELMHTAQSQFLKQEAARRARVTGNVSIADINRKLKALQKREIATAEQIIDARLKNQNVTVFDNMLVSIDKERRYLEDTLKEIKGAAEETASPAFEIDSQALRQALFSDTPLHKKNQLISELVSMVVPLGKDGIKARLKLGAPELQYWVVSKAGKLAVIIENIDSTVK